MRKYLIILVITSFIAAEAAAQGCVAIRSTGAVCTRQDAEHAVSAKAWQLNISHRYFKSHRHFVGTEEQKEREENNTEVINWSHATTFSLIRHFNKV